MERITTFDFSSEQSAAEQVGGAVGALLAESSLPLPDFLRAQMEESILHAVAESGSGARDPLEVVRLRMHFNEEAGLGGSSRWGFFLVQKRAAGLLLLDVHLYQE